MTTLIVKANMMRHIQSCHIIEMFSNSLNMGPDCDNKCRPILPPVDLENFQTKVLSQGILYTAKGTKPNLKMTTCQANQSCYPRASKSTLHSNDREDQKVVTLNDYVQIQLYSIRKIKFTIFSIQFKTFVHFLFILLFCFSLF